MKYRVLATLALAVLLASATGQAVPLAAGSGVQARMLAQVNFYRARNALPPLRAEQRLARAALAHAHDMAENDFFAHLGSDRSNTGVRARRAGYAWRAVGENIAAGLSSPEDTVDKWMASEGHRDNMLNAVFRDAGIAYLFRADDSGEIRYRHYWVLVLAARAEPPS